MASVVGICNSGLIKIGAERISSLSDDNKRAKIANEQYTKCRDEVLRAHPWNFAISRAALASTTTDPIWGYTYAFQLPTDCLRVLDTEDLTEFKVEGRTLITDESTVNIRYISQVTDVTKYDPLFCEALAWRLAMDFAYPISGNMNVFQNMASGYEKYMKYAKAMDGQEGTPEDPVIDDWINSRF